MLFRSGIIYLREAGGGDPGSDLRGGDGDGDGEGEEVGSDSWRMVEGRRKVSSRHPPCGRLDGWKKN